MFKTKQPKQRSSDIERISIPKNDISKFKEVFVYILNKVRGKQNAGQTVLYKLLYFIDFDYYELYEEQLMGLKYIKNKFGPTPVDFKKLIKEMKESGDCEEKKVKYYYDQTKYLPKREADLCVLSNREIIHINKTLKKYSDKSVTELSEIFHKDVPWIVTGDKEIINYETVFYRTKETSVRNYEDE
ncbi:MAG: SocA family protein [Endomicrobium sp.]|jgi:uncharacterized phage-associated protein|nr:SocA family protein [Endomicrobium sp.]